jgi:AraC-like DNA-binding protein
MDLLTDILQQAGLQRRLLDLRHLADRAALRFPCDRSIGMHVVTRGRVFIHAEGLAEPLALGAGDIALMARGCHHVVGTQATLPPGPIELASSGGEPGPAQSTAHSTAQSTAQSTALISGAYQFWNPPLHPLFAELPAWTVVRAESLPRLAPLSLTVALLGSEVAEPALGSEGIVHGLLDVAFSYLLREIVLRHGVDTAGWSQAMRAAPVRQAVELMHADTAHGWTLDELARRVGVSRTALAEKFREAMGDTPLAYLRTLRMQKAMRLLASTDSGLDGVAVQVGYTDAFSFSKVFKKVVGVPPREFRRRDAAERATPWRFG